MLFTNDPADPRHLIATDYWDSPEAQAGKPVLSFSGRCFRLIVPVRSVIGVDRYAQLAAVMKSMENCQFPSIEADSAHVGIQTGAIRTLLNWPDVYGITAQDFPQNPEACDFAIYVYAGKRGPRMAFRRKATHQAVPF